MKESGEFWERHLVKGTGEQYREINQQIKIGLEISSIRTEGSPGGDL